MTVQNYCSHINMLCVIPIVEVVTYEMPRWSRQKGDFGEAEPSQVRASGEFWNKVQIAS
jgi:hypothetical protein